MKRFETGLRRLALVLAVVWAVVALFGFAPGTGPIKAVIAISLGVTLILLAAEVVLFVIRGFAGK